MFENTVDARGLLCPKPLIMTKKALKSGTGTFQVLLDNRTACENVSRFLTDNDVTFNTEEKGDFFTLYITGSGKELKDSNTGNYCPLTSSAAIGPEDGGKTVISHPGTDHVLMRENKSSMGPVFCFRTDRMGEGPDELGKILIQACCNTLGELEPLPSALVFYNSGIHLALKNSPVIGSLKDLENRGVRILVCGTCADYFDVKKNVGAGIVSNMYDILECLSSASRIVAP
jgi:selenium metabolism protein YedF